MVDLAGAHFIVIRSLGYLRIAKYFSLIDCFGAIPKNPLVPSSRRRSSQLIQYIPTSAITHAISAGFSLLSQSVLL